MSTIPYKKCPITGNTSGLSVLCLIDPDIVEKLRKWNGPGASREEASSIIWTIHQIKFTTASARRLSHQKVRFDIGIMYEVGEFVLLPTHRTYMDAMAFSKRVGFCERDEEDYSPRRPLTALGRSFRYVFIPFTQAARELALEFPIQSQTDEDWNYGVHPDTKKKLPAWIKDYRVLDLHCHPVSVCKFARDILDVVDRARLDLTPWTSCLWRFERQWGLCSPFEKPAWFMDTSDRPDWDDESLSSSEASGYLPFLGRAAQAGASVPQYARDFKSSNRVLEWVKGVPRQGFVRHSACLSNKSIIPPCSQAPSCRRGKAAKASKPQEEEGWLKQNGCFPTHTFTSDDWAMFCHGIKLSGSRCTS
ncbi:hypothetical protein HDZ31DRAFT_76695 [Schizophyllum fasciatum]